MNAPKIISLGEALWDLFPDGEKFGGAPANFACHAAIQGADVTMVSAVGTDLRGSEAREILQRIGVDVSLVQIDDNAPTGTVGIHLDEGGKPTFTIHEGVAWDHLAWSDELGQHVSSADAIYFGTLGQRGAYSRGTIRQAAETASAAGVPRVLDLNLRPPFFDAELIRESIHFASILKLSDEELPEACSALGVSSESEPEAQLHELLDPGNLDMVVMTRGADGALLVTPEVVVNQNGIPAKVVDTVGAGDSFLAAFLIGELRGDTHQQNLRHACEVASVACSHSGAVPLSRREI